MSLNPTDGLDAGGMSEAALEDEQSSKAGQENDYKADQMDLTTREVRLGAGGGGCTHQEHTNILGNSDQSMAGWQQDWRPAAGRGED